MREEWKPAVIQEFQMLLVTHAAPMITAPTSIIDSKSWSTFYPTDTDYLMRDCEYCETLGG